jgi:hypothetical protein
VLKNFYLPFSRGVIIVGGSLSCMTLDGPFYYYETYIRQWVAFALSATLPCAVVMCTSVVITVTLFTHAQTRHALHQASVTSSNSANQGKQMYSKNEANAIKLAYITAIMYCVLVVPNFIEQILEVCDRDNPNLNFLQLATNVLLYIDYSLNFYFYCLASNGYRSGVRSLFSRGK